MRYKHTCIQTHNYACSSMYNTPSTQAHLNRFLSHHRKPQPHNWNLSILCILTETASLPHPPLLVIKQPRSHTHSNCSTLCTLTETAPKPSPPHHQTATTTHLEPLDALHIEGSDVPTGVLIPGQRPGGMGQAGSHRDDVHVEHSHVLAVHAVPEAQAAAGRGVVGLAVQLGSVVGAPRAG